MFPSHQRLKEVWYTHVVVINTRGLERYLVESSSAGSEKRGGKGLPRGRKSGDSERKEAIKVLASLQIETLVQK